VTGHPFGIAVTVILRIMAGNAMRSVVRVALLDQINARTNAEGLPIGLRNGCTDDASIVCTAALGTPLPASILRGGKAS
jgi:hypothetical protein